jgi:Glycosyl hydrolase catalytic core
VAALVMSLFAPSAAAAVRTEFFGIVQGPTLSDLDIQGMSSARVQTNRFLFDWKWVQKDPGPFHWGNSDRFIGRLASKGIRALPALWGNPDWVDGARDWARPPIDRSQDITAWKTFLKGVLGRYGRGGTYWPIFDQKYPAAERLPITAVQVWNEPNLKKFFVPYPSAREYTRLLKLSHEAIKSKDQLWQAKVVLAGMPSNGEVRASDFLNSLYSAGAKPYFDIASLHPYAKSIDRQHVDIQRFRNVMTNRNDRLTPLWLTELAWGSAPPDRFGINKGLEGQRKMLRATFNLVLDNRKAWKVDRLFWYRWRDPRNPVATCSFCGSAGLLKYSRAEKPAYPTFLNFTAETDPPAATITSGPGQGGLTSDSTPTFTFTSSEAGSTFLCRLDGGSFKLCASPRTLRPLADGAHTFAVKAIDAPGNVSPGVSRSFGVDTQAPPAPRITDIDPNSPANDNAPEVKGSAETPSSVKLFKTVGCTGAPVASGSATQFASPGITVLVADNTTTSFAAKARDPAGNTSPCSAAFTYVEDSTP